MGVDEKRTNDKYRCNGKRWNKIQPRKEKENVLLLLAFYTGTFSVGMINVSMYEHVCAVQSERKRQKQHTSELEWEMNIAKCEVMHGFEMHIAYIKTCYIANENMK